MRDWAETRMERELSFPFYLGSLDEMECWLLWRNWTREVWDNWARAQLKVLLRRSKCLLQLIQHTRFIPHIITFWIDWLWIGP